MQIAGNYMTNATLNMERMLPPMPAGAAQARPLPSTMQEITRYVGQLLTPEEEAVCDMATD